MRRTAWAVVVGLIVVLGGTATAEKLPCTSELSCARACSVKNPRACARLEEQVLDALLVNDTRSVEAYAWLDPDAASEARAALAPVCAAKQDRSCLLLGELEELGLGGPTDAAAATARYEAACDRGDGAGCYALGHGQVRGSLPGKPKGAFRRFELACQLGLALGCGKLGLAIGYGYGTARNRARGLTLLTEACETQGDGLSCVWLADVHRDGAFGQASPERADAALERACEVGSAIACEAAAAKTTRPAERRALLEKGCELGAVASCVDRAGETEDGDAARVWHGRACTLGHAPSCVELATAYREGDGVKKNLRKARQHAARACEAGGDAYCARASR